MKLFSKRGIMSAIMIKCPLCEDSFSMDEYGNCKNHFYTSAYAYKINKEFYYNGIKELYEKVNAKEVFENLVQRAFLYETNLFPMLRLVLYLESKEAIVKNVSKTSAGVVIKLSAN